MIKKINFTFKNTRFILLSIISVFVTLTISVAVPYYKVVTIFLFGLHGTLIFFAPVKQSIQIKFYFFIYIFYILWILTFSYINFKFQLGNRYLDSSLFFYFFLIYNEFRFFGKKFKNILLVQLILFCITLLSTIYELRIDPFIIRNIISLRLDAKPFLLRFISGYDFFYLMVFYSLIIYYWLLSNIKRLFLKRFNFSLFEILSFLIFVLSSILIISSNLLTGVIIFLIGIFIITYGFFFNFKINRIFFFSLFLIPFIYFSLFYFSGYFYSFVSNYFPEGYGKERLLFIIGFFTNGNNLSEILIERDYVWRISLDSFLKFPIFGSISSTTVYFENNQWFGFGQHSFIFDTFSLYGGLIGLLNLFLIIFPFRKLISLFKNHSFFIIIFSFLVLLFSFVNNLTGSIGFASFLLLPKYLKESIHEK